MFQLHPMFHLPAFVTNTYTFQFSLHDIYQFLHGLELSTAKLYVYQFFNSSQFSTAKQYLYQFLYSLYQFLYSLQLSTLKLCLLLFLGGLVWIIDMLYMQPITDPLRHLPGPEGSLLESHLQQVLDPMLSTNTHKNWRKHYGKTFRFHGFGKHDLRLMSFDYRAISHVLYSKNFERPWQTRSFLSRLIGQGVFSVEGQKHTEQRRILHSALTPRSLNFMTPIFFGKAEELRERWNDILIQQMQHQSEDLKIREGVFDIANWMSRASFDIMGLTTLKHDFHSLHDESEPFYLAYRRMFNIADKGLNLRGILDLYFPILTKIWVNDDISATNESLRFIKKTGMKIVAERKAAIQEADTETDSDSDLLSLLIKYNNNNNINGDDLTDQQLLDHCSTFLLGGSDTVAVALSWCFYLLALNPDVQNRLRKELNELCDDDLSDSQSGFGCPFCEVQSTEQTYNRVCSYCARQPHWKALEHLEYLDNVVNETLRFCPPVHGTIRVATRDDYIPVSYPVTLSDGSTHAQVKPYYDIDKRRSLKIRKGSYVHIPIEGWSLSQDEWGQDALVFDPDRWDNKPSLMGVFGGGHHMCLGTKFSLAEIKIFISTLLPHFEFLPAENVVISKFNTILTRPFVSGKWEEGTQLPILIRRLK